MKILFNGDSWTYGANLENRDERFANLLAKKWNKEYIDISEAGCSNRKIYRKTIGQDLSKISLGVIQMTYKNRTEYYIDGKWENINPGRGKGRRFLDYYRDYYSEELGESDELMFRQAIIDHFAANNTELLLLTNSKDSKYGYDVQLNTPDIPLGATKHPDRVGHQILTHRIYETLNKSDTFPL